MNKKEEEKYGHFTTEITFDVDIEYVYIDRCGETEIGITRANMENYTKEIDIFPYLPLKVTDEIDEQIMEDIENER